MSIQSDLHELDMLEVEIKNLQAQIHTFKKQKKTIEDRIIKFLKDQETQGIKYKDKAILLENRNFRNKKSKSEKMNDISSVLRKHGIKNSEGLLEEILEVQRGNESMNAVLKKIQR
jgi:hypothetical protein